MRSRGQSRGGNHRSGKAQASYGTLHSNKKSSTKFPQISGGPDQESFHESRPSTSGGLLLQPPNTSGLQVGVCSMQGKRPYQEDEYCLHPHLHMGGPDGETETHFFGLFDGHAGGRCSKHVAAFLPGKSKERKKYA
jgi:hypothetical protein